MRVNASCPTCRKRIFDSGEPAGAPSEGNNSSGGAASNTTGGAPTGTSSGGSNTNTGSSMNPMFMFTGSSGRGTGGSTISGGNVSGEVALNSYPSSVSGVGSSSSRFSLINTRMATASSAGGYSLIPTSSHGSGHQHSSSSGVGSRSGGDLIDTADQGEEGRQQQQQEHDPSHLV